MSDLTTSSINCWLQLGRLNMTAIAPALIKASVLQVLPLINAVAHCLTKRKDRLGAGERLRCHSDPHEFVMTLTFCCIYLLTFACIFVSTALHAPDAFHLPILTSPNVTHVLRITIRRETRRVLSIALSSTRSHQWALYPNYHNDPQTAQVTFAASRYS